MPTPTALRNAVAGLSGAASRDLAALWRQVETAAQAETALRDILPGLVDQYGAAAAVLATEWYDSLRAKADVPGRFFASPARIDDTGTQALVGWALAESTDLTAFRSLIEGGMQRRIANFSRLTVSQNSIADPAADGWQRVGDGSSCAFCSMLISRGSVFSESSADFASHDKCGCSAAPAFSGQPRPVKPYAPSLRNTTDADRARVREYLRTH
jgi:hypothetical protein